ncbi:retroviral-like aspartic protease [Candidatus Curtissbacteria bacterium]|nr:retroviral-like aspartic protease [Candidatus Curtissbacteria bacterium]
MKLRFPYEISTSLEFGDIPTTSFWLSVDTSSGLIPFLFLFDTGADVSSLPVSAAKKLGIDLDKCPQIPMSGYEGTTISVYKSKIRINFNKKPLTIPCVFHPNDDVPILLGRAGILDRFNIFMDGHKKEITFEEF